MGMTDAEMLDYVIEYYPGNIHTFAGFLENMVITEEGGFLRREHDGEWIEDNHKGDSWLDGIIEMANELKNAIASRRDSQDVRAE